MEDGSRLTDVQEVIDFVLQRPNVRYFCDILKPLNHLDTHIKILIFFRISNRPARASEARFKHVFCNMFVCMPKEKKNPMHNYTPAG